MEPLLRTYPITPGLAEDALWREYAAPGLRDLPKNVVDICHYGFTEMVNNVLDHAASPDLGLSLHRVEGQVLLGVFDRGVGIFRKLRNSLGLESEHDAALELAKGGVTTDPERHTGEGIFFTARMFDDFYIRSGGIAFRFRPGAQDWLMEDEAEPTAGTGVIMTISESSTRTTRGVFDRFTSDPQGFDFDTSVLSVRMFGIQSGPLVSRSQAKRLLSRLERFRSVVLDFEGVQEIGPAFADEVFRVFAKEHPGVRIVPIHTNESVSRMILRAVMANGDSEARP